jgi:hypothetical protein
MLSAEMRSAPFEANPFAGSGLAGDGNIRMADRDFAAVFLVFASRFTTGTQVNDARDIKHDDAVGLAHAICQRSGAGGVEIRHMHDRAASPTRGIATVAFSTRECRYGLCDCRGNTEYQQTDRNKAVRHELKVLTNMGDARIQTNYCSFAFMPKLFFKNASMASLVACCP